ncbi:MAG: S8 family serine peptidase, partial [Gammaproteobacteria bacterium]|nr:S8 family serine peptidase [Gammaproteobacteria bacterium]
MLFHKGVSDQEVQQLSKNIKSMSLEVFDAKSFSVLHSAIIVLSPEDFNKLAAADIVRWIEPVPPPDQDDNFNNAQPLSNVDDVQIVPYNLNGTGVTVGVWEAGDVIDTTPLDFGTRVIVQSGQVAGSDDHAVHVAGTIGGSGVNVPAAEGMAPSVTIASWDSTSDAAEMTNAANSTGAVGQPTPIQLSNHSYGVGRGWNGAATVYNVDQSVFGQYTNVSSGFDNVVTQTGLIIFKAAGNDRDDVPAFPVAGQPGDCLQGGFGVAADCLGERATAKNVITVGAMNGAGAIAGFSSYGPTDDGRIKPDIVAQGFNMTSLACNCFDDRDGDGVDDIANTTTATRVMSGTSMATPVATGVGALLLQEASSQGITLTAEGMKALMIQTAQDVNGPGQSRLGPDYATGWGIVDAQAAADLLRLPA